MAALEPDKKLYDIRNHPRYSSDNPEKYAMIEKQGYGSGGGGGNMDQWEASVENRLGFIHTDLQANNRKIDSNFWKTLGVFAAGFVFMLGAYGAMWNAFDLKFDRVDRSIAELQSDMAVVKTDLTYIREDLKEIKEILKKK